MMAGIKIDIMNQRDMTAEDNTLVTKLTIEYNVWYVLTELRDKL